MIRRTTDDLIFSDESLKNIANKLKEKDSRQLYKICTTQEDAVIAIKELKLKGYNYDIVNRDDKCLLYSIQPESIDLREAKDSGQFKKLAWGRYSFQKVSEIGDFQKYNFDDGSIWKVITGQDGKQYLVKEVDDENEDKVIRTKLANLQKKAELLVNNNTIDNIITTLFGNYNYLIQEMINDNNTFQIIANFIQNKFNNIIENKMTQLNITDQGMKNLVIEYISNKILSGEIKNLDSINNEIELYLNKGNV